MKEKTIHEVKSLLETELTDETVLMKLRTDKRKGVRRLVEIFDKKQKKERLLYQEFKKKWEFDEQYEKELVAGVDEAGRGPLAGPVVAAAVILPKGFELIGLTDSKQLSSQVRKNFYDYIIQHAVTYQIAVINHTIIDEINIYEATKLAMKNALVNLTQRPHIGLIDAVHLSNMPFRTEAIIKGDDKSIAIAAASILAKVKRDEIMEEIHTDYPNYNFLHNKGYGTKDHLHALETYGPCKYHRKSFSPVQTLIKS